MGTKHHNLWGSYFELAMTEVMCGMETIQTISELHKLQCIMLWIYLLTMFLLSLQAIGHLGLCLHPLCICMENIFHGTIATIWDDPRRGIWTQHNSKRVGSLQWLTFDHKPNLTLSSLTNCIQNFKYTWIIFFRVSCD